MDSLFINNAIVPRSLAMFRLVLFFVFLAGVSCQNCTAEHPLVGESFPLTTFSHDVAGTIMINDDCSFKIEDFVYDGKGPDVYVYGVSTELEDGEVPNDASTYELKFLPQGNEHDGSKALTVELPSDVIWDDIKTISIWCVEFAIDFGSAVLAL